MELVVFSTGDVKMLIGVFAVAAFRLLPAMRGIRFFIGNSIIFPLTDKESSAFVNKQLLMKLKE